MSMTYEGLWLAALVARRATDGSAYGNDQTDARGECMRLIDIVDVVLGARLGALPWGRAPILD